MSAAPPPGDADPTRAPRRLPIPAVLPRLTYVLIAFNVIVFAVQYVLFNWLGGDVVSFLGAKINTAIAAGQYWRLITPVFIHANLLHLFVNCYSLYVIGLQVESPFGYLRFLLVYLLSGMAGVILSFALSPHNSVGASGAIFGLVGALAVYLYRHRRRFGAFGRQRLMNLLGVIGLNLFFGIASSQIDNWGHVGGLAGGLLLGWLVGPEFEVDQAVVEAPRVVDRNPLAARWLAIVAVALALGAATSLAISLRR